MTKTRRWKGSVLASFQSSSPRDITAAIDVAADAFLRWRRTSVDERQQLGARFVQLVRERQEELAVIVAKENGKTLREARAEVHLRGGRRHLPRIPGVYILWAHAPDRHNGLHRMGAIPSDWRGRHH